MAENPSSSGVLAREVSTPPGGRWAWVWLLAAVFGSAELNHTLGATGRTFPVFLAGGAFCLAALRGARLRQWPILLLVAGLGSVASVAVFHQESGRRVFALLGADLLAPLATALLLRLAEKGKEASAETLSFVWRFLICSAVAWGVVAGWCAALLAGDEAAGGWGRWFLAGVTGLWLVTPVLLGLGRFGRAAPGRLAEAVIFAVTLVTACLGIFNGALPIVSLPSLLSMWAMWGALRFGIAGGSSAMLTIGLFALFATVRNGGPFVRADRTVGESLVRLLVYLAIWAGFLQIVAALQKERARAVKSLAELNQALEGRVAERAQSLSRTAKALRESEERFRLAAMAAGFGAYDHQVQTGELHWSPEMKALYGLRPEEPIVGAELLERFFLPEDRPRVQAAYARALDPAGSGVLEVEHRVRPEGGGERWVRVFGRTLFDGEGPNRVPVRAVGTCMDITERKQAEEALRESENRLALAVKAGHSGTFDWDARTDTNIWSDDLLALYGIERSEFGGRYADWLECVHPDDRALAEERIKDSFVTGQYSLQVRIRRRDTGAVRWMEARGTLLTDSEGRPARLLGLNVDITEQKLIEEALRESEKRMQFVLQSVNVGVWSIDLASGLLTASPECRRNFGLREGERFASYEDVRARIHPEDRAAEAEAAARGRARHGEYEAEYRVTWPDGQWRWILARGQADRGEGGRATRLSGIALDITERKEAERALQESESKLRSYYEAAPLFMGLVELDGPEVRHLYDNPASCRFFGMPAGGDAVRPGGFGLPAAAQELWRKHYRLSAARGEPVRFELSVPMAAGERWLSITVTPLPGGEPERPRFSYVAEDVTSRRRTEAALRQHATRQATLLELTRTILSKRSDANALGVAIFQRVSAVLEADIGFNYRLEEGVLSLVAAFGIPPEHLEAARRLGLGEGFCGAVAAGSGPLIAEQACIGSDPRAEFVRALGARAYACHPLLASDGRTLGTLSFASTRRTRFEPEEVSFLQTLSHYVAIAWERSAAEAAMQKARESAEGASRAKDEFLAALSHELRTPLNPVLLLASELQRQPDLSEEVRGDLATIRRNVELEARLIDDLLDLTRITRGKVHLELRPVEVHAALREALEILDSEVAGRELRLVLELRAEATLVEGDAVRLQQVFWNLLRNAIKFTPPGGTVTLRTSLSAAGRLCVEVQDTGEGIAAAHLRTIFDTFNQGEGGHRFGGLGLGLAIARSLVEMHGGSIRATSAGRGEGATFAVELPLLAAVGNGVPSVPRAVAEEESQPAPPRLQILLVEDHEPTRQALTRLLERRRHTVTSAATLAAARDLAERQTFDLLISDLGLPDGDSTELMQEFVLHGGPPGIALSGYGMDEDLQRTSAAGFFAHLVKPVDVDILDRTMAIWARERGAFAR